MNAYKRRGLTISDVLDFATFGPGRKQRGKQGRLAGNARTINAANAHIIHAMRYTHPITTANGYYSREDHIDAARSYLRKAREWRLELASC